MTHSMTLDGDLPGHNFRGNQYVGGTGSPAFSEWFGNSKVVDEAGAPLVVYHGTADIIDHFEVGHNHAHDAGWLGQGVYTTDSRDIASSYAMLKSGRTPNVLALYAKIENPYYATLKDKQRIQAIEHNEGREAGIAASNAWTDKLKAAGHDGVILRYDAKDVGEHPPSEYVVFSSTGVKSAYGNKGTYRSDTNMIADGDVPGHDFHGNQYTGGKGVVQWQVPDHSQMVSEAKGELAKERNKTLRYKWMKHEMLPTTDENILTPPVNNWSMLAGLFSPKPTISITIQA